MVQSICDSYPKFGAAAQRQTGVITGRKKWGRLTPPPPANRGLTLARTRCFATFARAGGGGGGLVRPPPGDRPLMVVELLRKKQSMRLDEISRLHILFLVLG